MPPSDLIATVEAAVGIYGSAPTCHLSSLARLTAYTPADWLGAVEQDRTLVRVRAMRHSVYTFPHELLVVAVAAMRSQADKTYASYSKDLGADYASSADKVERALRDGPLTGAELRLRVDPDKRMGSMFAAMLGRMASECRIVRATSIGSWRSNRLSYALWSQWIPDVDPWALDEEVARRDLAARYVAAYGPVDLDDLKWWTGWTKRDTVAAADGLDLTDSGRVATTLKGVRLLPIWDVLMVAYRNRDRLLDPAYAGCVYDRLGNATSVVLDAGRVVGVWDLGKSNDPLEVKVAPFGSWSEARWSAVEREVARIGEMLGSRSVSVARMAEPVDLTRAKRNRFLSPLSDWESA